MRVEKSSLNLKCDTGAQVNVLSLSDLKKVVGDDNPYWSETTTKLEVYGGTILIPLGKRLLTLYNDNVEYKIEFIILKENVRPLLGLNSLIELKLLGNIHNIKTSTDSKNMIVKKYHKLFQGVGQFEDTLQLEVQPGSQPVVRPPRRVPNALLSRLQDKLKSLEDHQIIEKVDHPKNFVSNLVIVEKKDKSLRICLDPKDLNKVLIRQYHLIPTLEEIVAKLCNKTIFSVLDLSDGFYNIKLDENSSDLCTFNSPFGCYKFKRLAFGVSVAPEIFQKYNEKTFGDIPGVIIYCDDLLICANSEEEHDLILKKVFERAEKCNVRFNKNKFQFKLNEVKYFGHIFSKEGMRIDPERVDAILKIKSPKNKKELQVFLGMVNYLRKFLPNLANTLVPLQLLLKKDVDWLWTEVHEETFNKIKSCISKAPILQNFNSKLPIVIQCDASKDGLGCCLMQNGKPVSFASRSLTPAEQNFSQIEKELLSVVWATRKFHYYIYGQKCIILNDHKPLESLLKKNIHDIPSPRLQRLKLKLLKYDIEFKYLKGKLMFIADLLSRSFMVNNEQDDSYMYEIIHCVGLASTLQCTNEQKQQLISESGKDEELSKIVEFIKNGWPENPKNIPDTCTYYYKFRAELTTDENLVFLNKRLIIPKSLRLYILQKLHEGHLGITKMKQLARNLYYWPKIDEHIEEFVRKCYTCQIFQNNNIKEPLMSHTIPTLPFSKIGIDIMEFRRKNYLVLYDYFSKWLEIRELNNKSANNVIDRLKDIFCIYGIPSEIICDHVPFDSKECKLFASEWGFKFTYSSPRYAQSNGMSERAVQISKNMLTKCFEEKSDIRIALLQYRSSPVSGTNCTPAQLLMNRNLKNRLPVTTNYLKPKLNYNYESEYNKLANRNVKNYNKHSRFRNEFEIGQYILFKKNPKDKKWQQGKILHKNDFRSYVVLDNDNVQFTRTSVHIRPLSYVTQ